MKPSEQIEEFANANRAYHGHLEISDSDYIKAIIKYLDEEKEYEVHCDCTICNP